MARLGIDFGTTNTVAAVHDRGMFCVVNHRVASSAGTVIQEVFSSSILIEPDPLIQTEHSVETRRGW